MTTKQAKEKIKKAGGKWKDFLDWMMGQTYGIDDNGEPNWYEWDVDRWIRYDFNPYNEPLAEWD